MAVGGGGVEALFWTPPITTGNLAAWIAPGVLGDGGSPGSGTVTSVGLALPAGVFSISGSPVTGAGTLTGDFVTQAANTIFAGPATGVAATPTFRSIVTADLPNVLVAGGPIGSSTVVPVITWDAKGRLTAVTTASIASGLTVGTTVITGGTTTRVLYDNAGVLGEYTNTQLTALINAATASLSGALPAWPNNTTTYFRGDGTYAALPSSFSGLANPTASVGLTAVNGVATTAMRSDGAPALDVGIVPTWTGAHIWSNTVRFNAAMTYGGVTLNNAVTGTGNMVLSTAPAFGATGIGIGGSASGAQGSITFYNSASGARIQIQIGGAPGINMGANSQLTWSSSNDPTGSAADLLQTRAGIAILRHGANDVASGAIAQTITFQGNTGATTTGPLALILGAPGGSGAGSVGGEVRVQGGVSGAAAGTGGAVSLYGGGVLGAGTTPILGLTVQNTGNVQIATARTLAFASGTNQRAGNATLVGGTVTVSNTTVTANTLVGLTRKTSGGTIGTGITYTLSAGTSFTITSDNILDTSVFSYVLIEAP